MTLLTVDDVAQCLDATPRTVRNWCESGWLEAQKLGRDWIIDEDALDGFAPPKRGRPTKEATMSGEELFDLFVAHGTAVEDIAAMEVDDLTQQIHEMRMAEPDDIAMSDIEVARAILSFARS